MFDCVMPTRNARNGTLFTWAGRSASSAVSSRRTSRPLDDRCGCDACRNFLAGVPEAPVPVEGDPLDAFLNTIHNVHFYQELMRRAREGDIVAGRFAGGRPPSSRGSSAPRRTGGVMERPGRGRRRSARWYDASPDGRNRWRRPPMRHRPLRALPPWHFSSSFSDGLRSRRARGPAPARVDASALTVEARDAVREGRLRRGSQEVPTPSSRPARRRGRFL